MSGVWVALHVLRMAYKVQVYFTHTPLIVPVFAFKYQDNVSRGHNY